MAMLRLGVAISLALMGGLAMAVDAAADYRVIDVVLGTATPGGGFPLYGDAFVATVRDVDPLLWVTPRNTKGSTENVPLLEEGKLDIALVQGEVAHEALSGVGRPPAALKIIAAMYSTPGMFVVRADSPYHRIRHLRGTPWACGGRAPGAGPPAPGACGRGARLPPPTRSPPRRGPSSSTRACGAICTRSACRQTREPPCSPRRRSWRPSCSPACRSRCRAPIANHIVPPCCRTARRRHPSSTHRPSIAT